MSEWMMERLRKSNETLAAENERLRAALEVEGLRLAACDVVALADTPESAIVARQMQPDYRSAALSSVERRVDEVIALRAEVERLQKRDAEWTEKAAAWLSSAEAAQRLDGYRELAARVNELTLQRDEAVTLLAEWCHAVDGGASWDYWDNQYKEARWGKGILRSLIDAEIAKLEGESNA